MDMETCKHQETERKREETTSLHREVAAQISATRTEKKTPQIRGTVPTRKTSPRSQEKNRGDRDRR